jgi:hypothetical protein
MRTRCRKILRVFARTSVLIAGLIGLASTALIGANASVAGAVKPPSSPMTQSALANIGVPQGIPSTPVANVASCPTNPRFSNPLPKVAKVSVALDASGKCTYTVSDGGDPVTFNNDGISYMAEDTVYTATVTDAYASPCTFSYEGGNFYVAFGSIRNDSGYCNTDGTGIWDNVEVANTALEAGAAVSTNTFHQWAQSLKVGTFFFLQWEVCEENPLGQQTYYFCNYGLASPLF